MKTEVVLKLKLSNSMKENFFRLMKTEVVLKLKRCAFFGPTTWFNENRSCIEIVLIPPPHSGRLLV